MKSISSLRIFTIGLALFSMLFGAGNLMYPIKVGMDSGEFTLLGYLSFCITAVLLPLAGIIGIILFHGDYVQFFKRLGDWPGELLLAISLFLLGPIIAIPRLVTLCHIMLAPFIPWHFLHDTTSFLSCFLFALLFLSLTFILSFRINRIIDVLGYVASPLLLLSLFIIVLRGIITAQRPVETSLTLTEIFTHNIIRGYLTLDLLASIFFTAIILRILRNTYGGRAGMTQHSFGLLITYAGGICIALLSLAYAGLSLLGMYHGHGLAGAHEGELFREVSYTVFPHGSGSFVIVTAVLTACLCTAVALTTIFTEYLQTHLTKNRISYETALALSLLLCLPLSTFGLQTVLGLSQGPLTYIGYPVIITLTFCNIAYMTVGFKPVKVPVLFTFVVALLCYLWR